MVCLGFELGVAGWKARTNPLSYGGTLKKARLPDRLRKPFISEALSYICSQEGESYRVVDLI